MGDKSPKAKDRARKQEAAQKTEKKAVASRKASAFTVGPPKKIK